MESLASLIHIYLLKNYLKKLFRRTFFMIVKKNIRVGRTSHSTFLVDLSRTESTAHLERETLSQQLL